MRYIGNKSKLLLEIDKLIKKKELKEKTIFCDAFAGTGTVGDFFKDNYKIIANDNMYFSFVITNAKLNNVKPKFNKLKIDPFEYFNNEENKKKGFVYKNYSPGESDRKYFSEENAQKIDFIRSKIEEWNKEGVITKNEYYYLLGSLIESISKVANIAGVYGSFLKKWDSRALKKMKFIPIETIGIKNKTQNEIYNKDIRTLIDDIEGDILYLDPPYTKNQYSTQYHVLETISLYDNPQLKGKTGTRDNKSKSSKFCKEGGAEIELDYLISKAKFNHIIMSYSSKGLMTKQYIESVFKRYGKKETFECVKIPYRRYLNSRTEQKEDIYEYLFYIEKKEEYIINSPLNYIGGKGDMIEFLKSNMPENIETFIDVFGGGFNVGINVETEKIIYNDINFKVKELLEMFKEKETQNIYTSIKTNIKKYNLHKGGKENYLKLREYYNLNEKNKKPEILYLLILFGFQQQIRFNSNLQYNNPVGQAGMNDKILEKIISFSREIKEKDIEFLSIDFESLNKLINRKTFVYCDPPYLNTLGSYNDGKRGFNGWGEKEEKRFLMFLEDLSNKGVMFMLSNVIEHKEKKNNLLLEYIEKNNWKIIEYKNKARKNRKEVIVINY